MLERDGTSTGSVRTGCCVVRTFSKNPVRPELVFPIVLSLSKDKLSAGVGCCADLIKPLRTEFAFPSILSLSKDKLSANGTGWWATMANPSIQRRTSR
jgi:hypothetical protein